MRRIAIIVSIVLLTSCTKPAAPPLNGPWRVSEDGGVEHRFICRWLDNNCVNDGQPGPMVYGAGWDKNYIVLVRHPPVADGITPDYGRSQYYYIVRSADETKPGWRPTIGGPFDEAQFDRESDRLKLPVVTIWR